jgi:hypothetical protein
MRLPIAALLCAASLQAVPLRLEPGEYRWLPFTVQRIPTAVDCRFRVLEGGATVHMEIMPSAEFRRFSHGREYEPLAAAPDGRTGEIKRLVDKRGEFAVVVENESRGPAALVDLEVSTNLNPPDAQARVLSPERRLAVILISFGIFFGLVTWSGWRLWRGANAGRTD